MKAFSLSNPPVFGVDYDVGWAGFTFYPKDILSEAIAYGERWERATSVAANALRAGEVMKHPTNRPKIHPRQARAQLRWQRQAKIAPVSHAFLCTGKNDGIEAHMETGVARFRLEKYISDEHCQVYFRKPKHWSPDMGNAMVAIASRTPPLGCPYDLRLIGAMSFNYTLTGHLLNWMSGGWVKTATCKLLSQRNHFICSMTVARIYQTYWLDHFKLPRQYLQGCLKQDPCTVDPQQLFDDDAIFEGDGNQGGDAAPPYRRGWGRLAGTLAPPVQTSIPNPNNFHIL